MDKLEDHFTAAQITKAKEMAARSIGQDFTIRLSKSDTVSGVIDACAPDYPGFTGHTKYVVFSVDMLCGTNKTRRNFKVKSIPK